MVVGRSVSEAIGAWIRQRGEQDRIDCAEWLAAPMPSQRHHTHESKAGSRRKRRRRSGDPQNRVDEVLQPYERTARPRPWRCRAPASGAASGESPRAAAPPPRDRCSRALPHGGRSPAAIDETHSAGELAPERQGQVSVASKRATAAARRCHSPVSIASCFRPARVSE